MIAEGGGEVIKGGAEGGGLAYGMLGCVLQKAV